MLGDEFGRLRSWPSSAALVPHVQNMQPCFPIGCSNVHHLLFLPSTQYTFPSFCSSISKVEIASCLETVSPGAVPSRTTSQSERTVPVVAVDTPPTNLDNFFPP